jgi:hypothetical protein
MFILFRARCWHCDHRFQVQANRDRDAKRYLFSYECPLCHSPDTAPTTRDTFNHTPSPSAVRVSPLMTVEENAGGTLPTRTLAAVQARADLDATKLTAGVLSRDELQELRAWIDARLRVDHR